LTPILIPVTAEEFDVGDETVPVPAITDHIPVPTIGALAFNVEADEQIVESNPAFAIVGKSKR